MVIVVRDTILVAHNILLAGHGTEEEEEMITFCIRVNVQCQHLIWQSCSTLQRLQPLEHVPVPFGAHQPLNPDDPEASGIISSLCECVLMHRNNHYSSSSLSSSRGWHRIHYGSPPSGRKL